MTDKKKKELAIRSSAAEYLTFVASTGESDTSFEMRYEDENIWLTQKMMAALYDVTKQTISQHINRIYADGELTPEATVKKYLTVQTEEMEQYKGYTISDIDPFRGTVTFTNGGSDQNRGKYLEMCQSLICAGFRFVKLSFLTSRRKKSCLIWESRPFGKVAEGTVLTVKRQRLF